MSLVNDALKKARLEAARDAAANRNLPYPALGRGEREPNRAWIAAFAGLLLLAGLGGFFLFRAGKQSALRTEAALPAGTPSEAESASGLMVPDPGREPQAEAAGSAGATGGVEPGVTDLRSQSSADTGASAGSATRSERAEREPDPPARAREESRPVPRAEPATPAATDLGQASRPRRERAAAQTATTPPPTQKRPPAPAPEQLESTAAERSREPAALSGEPTRATEGRAAAVESIRSADIPGVGPVELGGIAWSGDRPFALVNGRVVRPGDSVAGLLVSEIQSNTVRLSGASGDWVLKLK